MLRQIFGIVNISRCLIPQSQRIVTIGPIQFVKKASVVGSNTRPLDDGGLRNQVMFENKKINFQAIPFQKNKISRQLLSN